MTSLEFRSFVKLLIHIFDIIPDKVCFLRVEYLQWLISLTHTGVAPAISNVLAWPPEEINQQSGCSFSLFSCRRRPKCVNNCDPRDGRPANQVTDRW